VLYTCRLLLVHALLLFVFPFSMEDDSTQKFYFMVFLPSMLGFCCFQLLLFKCFIVIFDQSCNNIDSRELCS
jgi:hypothetical protein